MSLPKFALIICSLDQRYHIEIIDYESGDFSLIWKARPALTVKSRAALK